MSEYVHAAPAGVRGGKINTYHTNPDCKNLGRRVRIQFASIENNERWRECRICSGEYSQPSTNDRSIYDAAVAYDG